MSFYSSENFQPESSIGFLMRVCHQLTMAGLDETFAEEGLTSAQWSALISIHFGRGMTCAALARELAHDKGAMTRLVDALEARGLVVRERASDDRRVINLSLTDLGRETTMRLREKVIACWNIWLADWDAAEIEGLIAQLQKLRHVLETRPSCAA